MAFDPDPNATHDPATGTDAPAAWGDIINANFAALGAAWAAFTPTWTGTGSNPAIGNGTLAGAYRLTGKTLDVRYFIKLGSTTTLGSGSWRLSLPTGSAISGTTQHLSGLFWDANTSTPSWAIAYTGEVISSYTLFELAGTAPTWATNDRIIYGGTVELA